VLSKTFLKKPQFPVVTSQKQSSRSKKHTATAKYITESNEKEPLISETDNKFLQRQASLEEN
jgi:hypothetical protein